MGSVPDIKMDWLIAHFTRLFCSFSHWRLYLEAPRGGHNYLGVMTWVYVCKPKSLGFGFDVGLHLDNKSCLHHCLLLRWSSSFKCILPRLCFTVHNCFLLEVSTTLHNFIITGRFNIHINLSTWNTLHDNGCRLKRVLRSSVDNCTHHKWVSSWCWSQYRCIDVITGECVLDVVASTGVLMWSQVSEFLMLKPVQVASRAHLIEQSFTEDDDVVSFAVSNAHISGPFSVFLESLNAITVTELRRDVTGIITSSSISSSGGRNNGTSIFSIFTLSIA